MKRILKRYLRQRGICALRHPGYRGFIYFRYQELNGLLDKICPSGDVFKFVQIGANDGVRFDTLFEYVTQRPSRGLVVEPLTPYFRMLKKNYLAYPSIQPVQVAIHREFASATIYYFEANNQPADPSWEGLGSFNREHFKQFGVPDDQIQTEEVPCVSVNHLLAHHHLQQCHLLQIDTEGYDAEIVNSLDFNSSQPVVIKFEHTHLDKKITEQTRARLREHGYLTFADGSNTIAVQFAKVQPAVLWARKA